MANSLDRQQAIELRRQGKTYSEIKRELGVAKSTLSNWLSQYPLTPEQLKAVKKRGQYNRDLAVERIRITKQRKRQERLARVYQEAQKELLPLSERELYLLGLFLYWGEGFKDLRRAISLSNTDPKVMKFFLYWALRAAKVPKNESTTGSRPWYLLASS
jgi:transposase-like protein